MIRFDLSRLYPKFILQDKNGYAMAKAIEAGLIYFLETVQAGIDCILDPDKMPEWRLDEMAWELNSLYDYTADVETKRRWIRDAIPLYSIWGTPKSVVDYLSGYFDAVELEEFWQYGGDPYHFRLTLTGEWTGEKEAWARRAIERAKNVRSVMDTLAFGAGVTIKVGGELDGIFRVPYSMTGTLEAGTWPQENTMGIVAEGRAKVSADEQTYPVPYTMTGTYPDTATLGKLMEGKAKVSGGAEKFNVPYTMAGTVPDYQVKGPVVIKRFTSSESMYEYGHGWSTVFSWLLSKTPTALTINGESVPRETEASYAMGRTGAGTEDYTFTLAATDEYGYTTTAEAVLRVAYRVYWGAATREEISEGHIVIVDDEPVIEYTINPRLLDSNELTNNRARTFQVNAGTDEYIWLAVPSVLGECTFSGGNFTLDSTVTVDRYDYPVEYRIYRSEEKGLGNVRVVVQ